MKNLKNIEILTFDELFERACYISEGKIKLDSIINDDDLPF